KELRVAGTPSELELELELLPDQDAGDAAQALTKAWVEAGVAVRALSPAKASLEEVFSALTEPGA
ncbi:MAG: hypothetical protein M3020_19675, partial [Myxococcota bacterium]|nr:hypothetical protein [Myxococcota bacterium]